MASSRQMVLAVSGTIAVGIAAMVWSPSWADSLSERQAKIAELTPDAKQQLLVKFERFRQLSPAEKHRLHELHRAIQADPEREQLLATLDRYAEWLQTINAAQRAELTLLDDQERIKRIRELMEDRKKPQSPFFRPLSTEDREVVRAWVEKQALANLPADRREEFDRLSEEDRRRALVRLFLQRFQPFDPTRRGTLPALGEMMSLLEQLSEPLRNEFANAEPPQKFGMLSGWVMQSIGMSVNEEQLRKFFDGELNVSERQKLLAMPGDEMQRELRRMYFRSKGSDFGMSRFDGGRPMPPPGGFQPGQRGPFKEQRGKGK